MLAAVDIASIQITVINIMADANHEIKVFACRTGLNAHVRQILEKRYDVLQSELI